MSNGLPESVDAWRMVAAGRVFEGRIGLDAMTRLAGGLGDVAGDCRYVLGFGRDPSGMAVLELQLDASLPLICQRTLERFELPVTIHQCLGLIRNEREEAGLPAECEPVLVPADGSLSLLDVIEDELILALPLVPMSERGLHEDGSVWQDEAADMADEAKPKPFAALAGLKSRN